MIKKLQKRYRYSFILLRELVRKDFKIKYQDSTLGYVWTTLKPLFLFGILYAVFTVGLRIGRDIDHWPVALLAGVVVWQFFTDVTNSGLKAVVKNGGLLRKIKIPRYIVVISGTISAFLTLLINSVVVLLFAIFSGVELLPTIPMLIPAIIQVFILALGLAFLLSAIFVKFRDIQHIWEVLVRGMFYASAIIYPISMISDRGEVGVTVAKVLLMNPVSQVIQDIRHLAINPDINSLWTISDGNVYLYLIPLTISLMALGVGAWYFRKKSPSFAEDI